LPQVLDGVMAAKEAGLKVKINAAAPPRAFQLSQRLSNASQWRLHGSLTSSFAESGYTIADIAAFSLAHPSSGVVTMSPKIVPNSSSQLHLTGPDGDSPSSLHAGINMIEGQPG
jgi:hypothetical protein